MFNLKFTILFIWIKLWNHISRYRLISAGYVALNLYIYKYEKNIEETTNKR